MRDIGICCPCGTSSLVGEGGNDGAFGLDDFSLGLARVGFRSLGVALEGRTCRVRLSAGDRGRAACRASTPPMPCGRSAAARPRCPCRSGPSCVAAGARWSTLGRGGHMRDCLRRHGAAYAVRLLLRARTVYTSAQQGTDPAVSPTRYSPEETARRGHSIYERALRAELEAHHHGEVVAIDINTDVPKCSTGSRMASVSPTQGK